MQNLNLTEEEVIVIKKAIDCYSADLHTMEADNREEQDGFMDNIINKLGEE